MGYVMVFHYFVFLCIQKQKAYDKLWLAVRYGHRKLAGELIKEMKKVDAFNAQSFNALHENVSNKATH